MALSEPDRSSEALAAAAELDVVLDDNPGLLAVLNDMLRSESLPPGWEVRFDPEKGRREYVNPDRNEVQYTHPLLSYYRGAAFMETGGYKKLQGNEVEQPPAPQEVLDMCSYLGIMDVEDPYVMEVARMAISAPLPPNWHEGEDEEGNPLFTNRETGEAQPSHPLDPYFLELITRRRRELAIHSDGVGIRSALAAKRLHAIGVPGVSVPLELQDFEEEAQQAAAKADDDDGDRSPAHGFGPLVTIEEVENEGRDEDSDTDKAQLVKRPDGDELVAAAPDRRESISVFDEERREEVATSTVVEASYAYGSQRQEDESQRKDKEEEEEQQRLKLVSKDEEDLRGRDEEEEQQRLKLVSKDEEDLGGRDEEEEQQRFRLQDEDEEQRLRRQDEEEAVRVRQRREEAQELRRLEEEERLRLQDQEEQDLLEEQARFGLPMGDDNDDDGKQGDGEGGKDGDKEEEEEGQRQKQRSSTAGSERAPPTLSAGIVDLKVLRRTSSLESGVSDSAVAVPPPPADVDVDAEAGVTLAPHQRAGERENVRLVLGKQDDERLVLGKEDDDEQLVLGKEDEEDEERVVLRQAEDDDDEKLVLGKEEEEEDDDDARIVLSKVDDDEKLVLEKEEGDDEKLVLGTEDDDEGRLLLSKAEEQLVLGLEEDDEVVLAKPDAEKLQRKGDDDKQYEDDTEDYTSDFHSYNSSREGTRDMTRAARVAAANANAGAAASSRPATSEQEAEVGGVMLAAPVTPEKYPSRSPTPPVGGEDDGDGDGDARGRKLLDSDADGNGSKRHPSPPGILPPDNLAPRRRSPGDSRASRRSGDAAGDFDGEQQQREGATLSRASSRASTYSQRGAAAKAGSRPTSTQMAMEARSASGFKSPPGSRQSNRSKEGAARAEGEQEEREVAQQEEEEEQEEQEEEERREVDVYESEEEDAEGEAEREMDPATAAKLAAAKAAFDAKHPPLPIPSDEAAELRRTRSFTDVEIGRLQKQLAVAEAARAAAAAGTDAAVAAAMVGYKMPSSTEINLESRGGGTAPEADAGAAATAAAAAKASAPAHTPPQPARERIRVAVRSRPVPRSGEAEAWVVDPTSRTVQLREGVATKHSGADRVYSFDLVLGGESTTKQLWATHVVPLMDASLSGVNTTVFAYGQTGSGKTYTMFGSDGRYDEGAIGMSLTYLFKALHTLHKIKTGSEEYVVKVSMLELYNEQLRDLLAPGGGPFDRMGRPSGAPLALQDDPRTGVRVSGLTEQVVEDMPTAMMLVERGAASRSVGSTAMNEVSSRSHTIVRLALETRDFVTHELLHTSLISYVDLAGSERLAKTGSTGARFVEGTNINISLLMLGTVVSKLAEGRVGEFIPYRNSKLTRLLQPCLGGNSKTAIIATINPAVDQLEETFNTLSFATRAMDVVNQVSVNSYIKGSGAVGGAISGAAAAALQKQVATLKAELAAIRHGAIGGGGGHGGHMGHMGGMGHMGHMGGMGVSIESSVMAERLAKLELDKAKLLDRLEALTGKPQGDVYDDLPPTPPDLQLPASRPQGRSGSAGQAATSAAEALRSIARMAFMGRGAGGLQSKPQARQNEHIPPEEVVMAVREMRAERDELRRRDEQMRQDLAHVNGRVAELQPYGQLSGQVAEVVGMLENIMGPSPLADRDYDDDDPAAQASNQAARLAENVQAVSLMHNELSSLQRQLATSEATAAVAARRADAAESALQRVAATAATDWADGGDGRLKNMVEHLNGQLTAVRRELDVTKGELSRWRGLGSVAPEASGKAAAGDGGQLSGDEGGGGGEGNKRVLNPSSFNVGSFAIKRAREALAQVSILEARCNATEQERDELRERLQDLEEAVAAAQGGRAVLPAMRGAAGRQRSRPLSAPGDDADPLNASMGGPAGQQRFEQLKTHVSSLSHEVSALTRERDSLLAMVLKMQAPAPSGSINNMGNLLGGYNGLMAQGSPNGGLLSASYMAGNNVFSSVPLPAGMDMAGGGMRAYSGNNNHNIASSMNGVGAAPWEMESLMMPVRSSASPIKLKPVRGGRNPQPYHHHHHHKAGYDDLSERPDFNPSDGPLEVKQRVARLRDRASKLDGPISPPPGMNLGMGLMAKGLGIPPNVPEPVLYGQRDAEVYALKHKLAMAEKARSEAAARSQAEMRSMQQYRDQRGLNAQMAIAAASRDYKDQSRSHVAEMRQMEVAHEENLAAARAEAAAIVKTVVDENSRLKMILATAGPPLPGPRISGNGLGGGIDFPLRAMGGFGMSSDSPPARGGASHASPMRGANMSPGRGHSSLALPMLPPPVPRGARGGNQRR